MERGAVPAIEAARSARDSYRLDYDWQDADIVRVPEEAAIELIRLLAARVTRRVQQIVPLAPALTPARRSAGQLRPWGFGTDAAVVTNFAQAVSRSLVQLNRKVERIYVVPGGDAPSREVSSQVADDESNSIASCAVQFSDLHLDEAQRPLFGQMWIVDDDAVIFQEATEAGPPNWAVSAREVDVARAKQLWDELKGRSDSERDQAAPPRFDLVESFLVSADLLARSSSLSCTYANPSWERCDWYHGAWQYLRLFDMVSSPQWHHDFYRTELAKSLMAAHKTSSIRGGLATAPRILISGAADYSMFAYVVNALRHSNFTLSGPASPQVHMLDLCPTPLLASRWYAKRVDYPVTTHELDICRKWNPVKEFGPRPFDLIVTDAFLTRFSVDDCLTVLRRWKELLAPGGRVVTTVRLHGYDAPHTDHVQEAAAFVARARERARRWRPALQAGVEAICEGAREYAHRITSTNFGGEAEVRQLFHDAGFDVLAGTRKSGQIPGELHETRYLRIIAAKPSEPRPASHNSTARSRRRALKKGESHAVDHG